MTDTITPGQRINGFEVLNTDPSGKRVVVACACGGTHVFGVEALLAGTAACLAIGPTQRQLDAGRAELAERRARHAHGQAWRR